MALSAFDASGAKVWGRVDVMRGKDSWQLLEVNTIPGMTEHSLVPKAAAAAGISFVDLLAEIYQASVSRCSSKPGAQSDSNTGEKTESGEVRHGA